MQPGDTVVHPSHNVLKLQLHSDPDKHVFLFVCCVDGPDCAVTGMVSHLKINWRAYVSKGMPRLGSS
jgi:hypothetical protein